VTDRARELADAIEQLAAQDLELVGASQ
jgi:hypothetical protein